jgi:hypothetical protein
MAHRDQIDVRLWAARSCEPRCRDRSPTLTGVDQPCDRARWLVELDPRLVKPTRVKALREPSWTLLSGLENS